MNIGRAMVDRQTDRQIWFMKRVTLQRGHSGLFSKWWVLVNFTPIRKE